MFTADIAATFSTGLVVVYNLQQAVVMDRRMVAAYYALRGTLFIDVMATMPLWVEVPPHPTPPHPTPPYVGVRVPARGKVGHSSSGII